MDGVQFSTKSNCAVLVRFWHEAAVRKCPLLRGATTPHGPSAASFLDLRNPYFISGDAVPTGMGGRGISLVRGGGSTPTTGRGWMSTGATGLDWTTGGD